MGGVPAGLDALLSPVTLLGLGLGTILGLLAGLMPGINGRVGLVLVTPVALTLGPSGGAVFLIAFHSVVHTSGSIPAILFGVPTSASEAATVIDGHALTLRGQGSRAAGATIAASVAGGVLGAGFLFLASGPAGALVRHVGSPEIAALSILGLLSIALLSDGRPAAGLLSAGLGLLIGTVGVDALTGTDRFTFGMLGLWDGVSVAAVVTGLFVVPELIAPGPVARAEASRTPRLKDVLDGGLEVLRHGWLILRSAVIGIVVGVIPGLGVSGAVWLAYGHARQTHPSPIPYGEGAIGGVIAPEVANNAKEGGALAPTLLLGIPASSGMAILLAALMTLGLEPGPQLLSGRPDFIAEMAWTNVLANLIAGPACLLLTPMIVRVSALRRDLVAPLALAVALAATAATLPGPLIWGQLFVFSALGLLMARAQVPRAPLLLGLVLGPGLELTVVRSAQTLGWTALERPGVLAVIAVAVLVMLGSAFAGRRLSQAEKTAPRDFHAVLIVAVTLAVASLFGAQRFSGTPAVAVVMSAAAILSGAILMRPWRRDLIPQDAGVPTAVLVVFGSSLLIGTVSLPLAVAVYTLATLRLGAVMGWLPATGLAGAMSLMAFCLERIVV